MSDKERQFILFLEDIQTAIVKIKKYTEGLSFEEFCNFEMVVDANLPAFKEHIANVLGCEKHP